MPKINTEWKVLPHGPLDDGLATVAGEIRSQGLQEAAPSVERAGRVTLVLNDISAERAR